MDIKLRYKHPAKPLIILSVIMTAQIVDGHMPIAIYIMNIQVRSTRMIKIVFMLLMRQIAY